MTGRRWWALMITIITCVVVLIILRKSYQTREHRPTAILDNPFGTRGRSDTPSSSMQEKLHDSPSDTQEKLDAPSRPRLAQCTKDCSPCSKSPEYRNLTCHDIIETNPEPRPHPDYRRKVILSTDTENLFYAWFAPITSLLWMEVMKWKPIYILVHRQESEEPDLGAVFKYIIRHMEAAGAEVIKVRNTLPEPHYLRGMVVMTSRFLVGCRDWSYDPYMLISDGDMWPMNAEIFDQQTSVNASVHIIWPKEYVQGESTIPSCYVGMHLSTWREVMHIKAGDDMLQTIAGIRNLVSNGSLSKNAQWNIDQETFTKRLYHWRGFPDKVHFYPRDLSNDRLDRSNKRFSWRPGLLDSHVLRPGFIHQNWPRLRQLIAHFFNETQMKWADEYTERFCRLLFCTQKVVASNKKPDFHPYA